MIATHFSVHSHAILTLYSKHFHLQNLHAPLEKDSSFQNREEKKKQLKWKCYLFTRGSADGGPVDAV